MAEKPRGRAPHSLTKEQQVKLKESDKLREANPNKMGPDAPKAAAAPKPEPKKEDD